LSPPSSQPLPKANPLNEPQNNEQVSNQHIIVIQSFIRQYLSMMLFNELSKTKQFLASLPPVMTPPLTHVGSLFLMSLTIAFNIAFFKIQLTLMKGTKNQTYGTTSSNTWSSYSRSSRHSEYRIQWPNHLQRFEPLIFVLCDPYESYEYPLCGLHYKEYYLSSVLLKRNICRVLRS
jgi:hypothetical protein